MTTLDFVEKKRREPDKAYAVVVDNYGWRYNVLKRYAKDDGKAGARWLVYVDGAAPFAEEGDTYVYEVVSGAKLTQVEGREPTDDEKATFATVQAAATKVVW